MNLNEIQAFIAICEEFVTSSKKLRDAASLCDGDPVKQEMIAFVVPEFHKMCARSEGIKLLLDSHRFSENKEFILEEMRAVTQQNLEIARIITDKLECLN